MCLAMKTMQEQSKNFQQMEDHTKKLYMMEFAEGLVI